AAQDGHGQDRKGEAEAHLWGLLPVIRVAAQPTGSAMPPSRRTSRSMLSSGAHSASSPTAPPSPGKTGCAAVDRDPLADTSRAEIIRHNNHQGATSECIQVCMLNFEPISPRSSWRKPV